MTEDEDAAYARESEIITRLKRLHEGGPLTNLAPGGGSSSGAAPASKEKHSATLGGIPNNNRDRATLNGFVLSIASMKSVLLKPVGQFTLRPTQRFPNKSIDASQRQAAALIASAAANGILMDDDCQIPRRVLVEGVDGQIENGVACDIATCGKATLIDAEHPPDECFSLTEKQSRAAVGLVGLRRCFDLGVLSSFPH